MTAEIPRTKPNIMITARLLLMPVFSSVELNACAHAGIALRMRMAATMRSEGSRERTLSLMCLICLISFIRVSVFVFSRQRLFRRTRVDHLTSARSAGVCRTQHARSVRGKSGDEQNDRPHETHQAPRIGLSPAARNPRPVPHAATNHLRCAAWGTRIDKARAATWKLSSAWTNGRRQNRNGCRDDNESIQRGTLVPFRHERVSE